MIDPAQKNVFKGNYTFYSNFKYKISDPEKFFNIFMEARHKLDLDWFFEKDLERDIFSILRSKTIILQTDTKRMFQMSLYEPEVDSIIKKWVNEIWEKEKAKQFKKSIPEDSFSVSDEDVGSANISFNQKTHKGFASVLGR